MKKVVVSALLVFGCVLLLLAATLRLGWWPVAATATPPDWENRLAQAALHASLSRESAGLTNPLKPSNDVLLGGLKIFKSNCAGCHGTRNQPSPWGTRGFYPRAPQFAGESPKLSAAQMFVAIKQGVRYSGMGAWEGMLSDEEMWKVATFLEHIGSLPPEVEAEFKTNQ